MKCNVLQQDMIFQLISFTTIHQAMFNGRLILPLLRNGFLIISVIFLKSKIKIIVTNNHGLLCSPIAAFFPCKNALNNTKTLSGWEKNTLWAAPLTVPNDKILNTFIYLCMDFIVYIMVLGGGWPCKNALNNTKALSGWEKKTLWAAPLTVSNDKILNTFIYLCMDFIVYIMVLGGGWPCKNALNNTKALSGWENGTSWAAPLTVANDKIFP